MSYNTSRQHHSDIPEAFPPVVQPTMSLDEFWDKHVAHLPAKDTCRHVRISSGKSPPPHGLVETPTAIRSAHADNISCRCSPSNDSLHSCDTTHSPNHVPTDSPTASSPSVTRRIINHSPPPDYSDSLCSFLQSSSCTSSCACDESHPSVLSDTDHVRAGDARAMRPPFLHASFRPAMNRASSSSDSSFFTTEPLTVDEKQAILDKNKDEDSLRRTYPKTYEQSYEIINMTLLDMSNTEIDDYKILSYFNRLSKKDIVSVFVDLDESVARQLTYQGKTVLDIIGILNNTNHTNQVHTNDPDPSAMNHCCIVI